MVEELTNDVPVQTQEDLSYLKKRWKKKINKLSWATFWFQFTIQIVGIFVLIPLSALFSALSVSKELANWLQTDIMLYCIGFPIFYMIIHSMPDYEIQNHKRLLTIQEFITLSLVGLGILYGFNLIGSSISILITTFTGGTPNPLAAIIGNPFYTLIFGCVVPAIMEELIFRKLLIQKIYPLGDGFAILLSGLLFGFFHGNLAQIAYAIPLGCFFAYIYIRTNDIRNAMVLHFLANLCGTLLFPALVGFSLPLGIALMIVLVLFAIVYYRKHRHAIILNNGELTLHEKEKRKLIYTSKGFIAYTILTLLLVVLILFIATTA